MQQGIIYGADFFGDHGLHVRGDVREDHGKFVSADSRNDVFRARILLSHLGNVLQKLVPEQMTAVVVRLFKVIQIEEYKREFSVSYIRKRRINALLSLSKGAHFVRGSNSLPVASSPPISSPPTVCAYCPISGTTFPYRFN